MKTWILLAAMAHTLSLRAVDYNAIVLEQIRTMPKGGGYAVTREALSALGGAAKTANGSIAITAASATPSFCSGATYLVFLKTLKAAEDGSHIPRLGAVWEILTPRPAPDGVGIWGRWNANGPGASRLFHELELGRNFTSYEVARPGDFMKIFWTDAVGKKERGHLVVYLGREMKDGLEHVRFWSSNKPDGYGEKSVPRTKIARRSSLVSSPRKTCGRLPLFRKKTPTLPVCSRRSPRSTRHCLKAVCDNDKPTIGYRGKVW